MIISDFMNLKQQIVEEKLSKKYPPVLRNIKFYSAKKKLIESAEKLEKANTPLNKEEVLELAQSLHNLSIGYDEGFYDERVRVKYFPGAESYTLIMYENNFINSNLRHSEITVSKSNKQMEVMIEIDKGYDIIEVKRVSLKEMHTNVRELEKPITECNHALYGLILAYLHDILSEMR